LEKIHLKEFVADSLAYGVNAFFDPMANVEESRLEIGKPLILISEEALLFAKYLSNERRDWNPRMATIFC
jgi:hypothetical protein